MRIFQLFLFVLLLQLTNASADEDTEQLLKTSSLTFKFTEMRAKDAASALQVLIRKSNKLLSNFQVKIDESALKQREDAGISNISIELNNVSAYEALKYVSSGMSFDVKFHKGFCIFQNFPPSGEVFRID